MPNTAVLAAGGALPTAQPTIFLAFTPTMRLRIATTIENLIALLDEIDDDPDLGPDTDGEENGDAENEEDGRGCPVGECCAINFTREVVSC